MTKFYVWKGYIEGYTLSLLYVWISLLVSCYKNVLDDDEISDGLELKWYKGVEGDNEGGGGGPNQTTK